MIFENDIRLCRTEIMKKHYEKMVAIANEGKVHEI